MFLIIYLFSLLPDRFVLNLLLSQATEQLTEEEDLTTVSSRVTVAALWKINALI